MTQPVDGPGRRNRMVSVRVSHFCEMGRWVLDRLGIGYRESPHAPVLHLPAVRSHGGTRDVPLVFNDEVTLLDARELLKYHEGRCPPWRRLYPDDLAARAEEESLVNLCFEQLGPAVIRWGYFHLLPARALTTHAWTRGVSWLEGAVVRLGYPLIARAMRRSLNIPTEAPPADAEATIGKVFQTVQDRLTDGRRYLFRDRLGAADLTFAALAAPLVAPPEYSGPLPRREQLPPAMRADVDRWRASPAGQFVLRLFADERVAPAEAPIRVPRPGLWRSLKGLVKGWLSQPAVLRLVFRLLRGWRPILVLGRTVVVTRHADVREVLRRDEDFTIAEINAARMVRTTGAFILGMDRSSAYEHEASVLRRAVHPEDRERLAALVARTASALVANARPHGRLDVVGSLTRVVPARVIAEFFGVPGPDEPTLQRWMRVLFWDIFLNRDDDPRVRARAEVYAAALHAYLDRLIARRKDEVRKSGGPDDFLTRLVRLQGDPATALDDDGVRRGVGGVVVGALDTTSKAAAQAVDQLLRHPEALRGAQEAARAQDTATVARYVFEALRFNPLNPALLRHCRAETTLAAGTDRARLLPAGSQVFASNLSAMWDASVVDRPDEFRTDRPPDHYLHFSLGMHTCFGREFSAVQIPGIVTALLQLPGLRRAPGRAGQILYDGPFPDRLIVTFDREPAVG
jgi:cytochrome P450